MFRLSQPELQNLVISFRVPEVHRAVLGGGEQSGHPAPRKPEKSAFDFEWRAYRRELAYREALPPARLAHLVRDKKKKKNKKKEKRCNFYVLGDQRPTFIVFPKSGSVVATGLKSPREVREAVEAFAYLMSLPKEEVVEGGGEPEVINSTYSGSVISVPSGGSVYQALHQHRERECERHGGRDYKGRASITFRSQFFPGARIKWNDAPGTVTCFNNGKFVIVGVREEREARCLHQRLNASILNGWRIIAEEKSSAPTAGWCSTTSTEHHRHHRRRRRSGTASPQCRHRAKNQRDTTAGTRGRS